MQGLELARVLLYICSHRDIRQKYLDANAHAGELADEELARKLQAEENARSSRRSDRASRLAAASERGRRSTRSATAVLDASSGVTLLFPLLTYTVRNLLFWSSSSVRSVLSGHCIKIRVIQPKHANIPLKAIKKKSMRLMLVLLLVSAG